MGQDWSKQEVALIVKDYFDMFQEELQGYQFNKTAHRNILLPQLDNRTAGAIEFKHQNISSILAKNGLPFIKGYKPKINYQHLLEYQVTKFIRQHQSQFIPLFEIFASQNVPEESLPRFDFRSCLQAGPFLTELKRKQSYGNRIVKVDYLEIEQNNRALGLEGEQFVINYEKWRLAKARRKDLVNKIEWTSKDRGDGAGYDILSKNTDGSNRYIEVKTTKLSKETPIYLSKNEISFATDNTQNFYLYRVFNFVSEKKLFIKRGSYESFCNLIPLVFKGVF